MLFKHDRSQCELDRRRYSLLLLAWCYGLSLSTYSTASWLESLGNGLNRLGEHVEGLIERTVDGVATSLNRSTPPNSAEPPEVPVDKAAKRSTVLSNRSRRQPIRHAAQVSSVINILDGEQLQKYVQDPHRQLLVVMFGMSKKCMHCDRIKPAYYRLARTNPQTIFLNIDLLVPNMPKVAEQWGVTHFPTFFIFKPGENIATTRIVGAQAERLKNILSELTQALATTPNTDSNDLEQNSTEAEE